MATEQTPPELASRDARGRRRDRISADRWPLAQQRRRNRPLRAFCRCTRTPCRAVRFEVEQIAQQ